MLSSFRAIAYMLESSRFTGKISQEHSKTDNIHTIINKNLVLHKGFDWGVP
jgi:hypothetical protein